MGDMADYFLDEVLDWEEAYFDYLHSGRSEEEASFHLGDAIPRSPSLRACRCCGEEGLRWGKVEGKWRLFRGAKLHNCPVNPLKEKTDDE